jgi:hypothetical protein
MCIHGLQVQGHKCIAGGSDHANVSTSLIATWASNLLLPAIRYGVNASSVYRKGNGTPEANRCFTPGRLAERFVTKTLSDVSSVASARFDFVKIFMQP